jgi:PEP-CTERM motif
MKRRRLMSTALALGLMWLGQPAVAPAQLTTTWSNYDGANAGTFLTNINSAATTAGFPANYFNAANVTTIENGVQAELGQVYHSFSIFFTTTQPMGNYTTLQFFNTTTMPEDDGTLGISNNPNGLDWRNQLATNVVDIFPANFSFALTAPAANVAQNVTNLTMALGGTAAHELGHSFGLQHYDSYGDPSVTPTVPFNPANAYNNPNGAQNSHLMRTGGTGVSVAQRLTVPTLSTLETAKLEVANNLIANGFTVTPEQGAAHGTPATAQALTLTHLAISGLNAAVVSAASISAAGENDYYKFTVPAQSGTITLNTIANIGSPIPNPAVDTNLQLYDTNGTNLLASNDDITFNGNTLLNSGGTVYNTDSLILNYPLGPGTYFADVTGVGGQNTGNYELLVALGPIPEPSTLLLTGVAALAGGWWRRRRRSETVHAAANAV